MLWRIEYYKVIVDKSTVPVGTAEKVDAILSDNLSSDLYDVVSNPEFLREGSALEDFELPDRIIVGSKTKSFIHSLYKRLFNNVERIAIWTIWIKEKWILSSAENT